MHWLLTLTEASALARVWEQHWLLLALDSGFYSSYREGTDRSLGLARGIGMALDFALTSRLGLLALAGRWAWTLTRQGGKGKTSTQTSEDPIRSCPQGPTGNGCRRQRGLIMLFDDDFLRNVYTTKKNNWGGVRGIQLILEEFQLRGHFPVKV
jgi:hypothetical protein